MTSMNDGDKVKASIFGWPIKDEEVVLEVLKRVVKDSDDIKSGRLGLDPTARNPGAVLIPSLSVYRLKDTSNGDSCKGVYDLLAKSIILELDATVEACFQATSTNKAYYDVMYSSAEFYRKDFSNVIVVNACFVIDIPGYSFKKWASDYDLETLGNKRNWAWNGN